MVAIEMELFEKRRCEDLACHESREWLSDEVEGTRRTAHGQHAMRVDLHEASRYRL